MDSNLTSIVVSIGEIVDKLSILQIKVEKIKDDEKLTNIIKEHRYLNDVVFNQMKIETSDFMDLVSVNQRLWKIEDEIRDKERNKEFDQEFIDLARSVYITNDERSEIKSNLIIEL